MLAKGEKPTVEEELASGAHSILKDLSINTVSSLNLSLDGQDPRVLRDLTLNSESSLNRAGYSLNIDDITLNSASSLGDETLKQMQDLKLSDVSDNTKSVKTVSKSVFGEVENEKSVGGKGKNCQESSQTHFKQHMCRTVTGKSAFLLHTEDNSRFAKRYFVPLSESDLFTDDESMDIVNRYVKLKYVKSLMLYVYHYSL